LIDSLKEGSIEKQKAVEAKKFWTDLKKKAKESANDN